MHAPQIERAAQLGKQLCSVVGGLLASAPVADPVAAHDQNLCLRPLFENPRQGPHKNMEPAIWFEVAGAVGNDFICAGQGPAIAEPEARRRVWAHQCSIDTLVYDADAIPIALRVLRSLPFGWALSPIDSVES